MKHLNDEEHEKDGVGEDTSRYGEFIPTRFAWISLKDQKENAKRLQNITKKDKKQKNVDL